MTNLSRRLFIAGTAATMSLPALAQKQRGPQRPLVNPLIRQRADPLILRHDDGLYYFTASVPEYDRVILRRASTLAGLATAPEVVVWRRPASGRMAGYIWAPELHRIDGRWYIYVAAGDGDQKFRIRTYVLICDSDDVLAGTWSMLGQLQTPWDTFTLDSTSFVHRGTRYLCWAQTEPGIATNSNLYLAPLATPTTLGAKPTRLTIPSLPWEIQGYKVAEGPALLPRNSRLFLTYSASATDARYCMGMLTARDDADIMDPAAWVKSPTPVMTTSPEQNVFGPGHNSFTVDDRGRDMLVYHARDYAKIDGNPLFDPNRHTRVQPIRYDAEGVPLFMPPLGNGPVGRARR
jgi:GH43 family beta-xylosidase